MKYLVLLTVFVISLSADDKLVPVSVKSINWKEKITSSNVNLVKTSEKYKCKKYLDIDILKENRYRAKHYILKNRALCKENVFVQSDKKIRFNFGFVEIEKEGELIKETDQYIKIKNLDGTITKIYKDGSDN
ncbi:MAG: hypothetical protein U9Q20_01130 [Campylobacterota bacterium]|nr:hypothetical protein [Campylobacterota bacterium]